MLRITLAIFAIVWTILVLNAHADADRFDQEENALWKLVNEYRQENGVQPVGLNDQLMDAAAWMSNDMATNDRYSHIDSLGRNSRQRMADSGYFVRKTTTGENLAVGIGTAQAAFELWKRSPEHNDVMLSPAFCAIGIARAYDEDSAHGWYWTVDFGGLGPAWFPATPAPISVPPIGPYESPHGDETPLLEPRETPIPVPAALPDTGVEP